MSNGFGSAGRAVASDTIGLQFKSSHWQTLFYLFTVNCIEEAKINEKESGMGPMKKCKVERERKRWSGERKRQ